MRHGRASATLEDGDRYEGDFEHDALCGCGVMRSGDGTWYAGGFLHGQRHGRGTMQLAGGAAFDGFFRAGRRHGRGVTIGANGERLEARYAADRLHGPSRYFYERPLRRGTWCASGAPLLAVFSDADRPVRLTLRATPAWVLDERRSVDAKRRTPDVGAAVRAVEGGGGRVSLALRVRRPPDGAVGAFVVAQTTTPPPDADPATPPTVRISLELFAVAAATADRSASCGWGCGAAVSAAPLLDWEPFEVEDHDADLQRRTRSERRLEFLDH